MAEKGKRDFRGEDRLDVKDRHQVEYWAKRWQVSKDQVISAHRKAGMFVKDIAAELGKKK